MMKKSKSHIRYKSCRYCHRVMSVANLGRHEKACKNNPIVAERRKEKNLICEYCDKKYSEEESNSKRFCSKTCARSFSNSFINHSKKKKASCVSCGKVIEIHLNASPSFAKCSSCKSLEKENKKKMPRKKPCKFCGKKFNMWIKASRKCL